MDNKRSHTAFWNERWSSKYLKYLRRSQPLRWSVIELETKTSEPRIPAINLFSDRPAACVGWHDTVLCRLWERAARSSWRSLCTPQKTHRNIGRTIGRANYYYASQSSFEKSDQQKSFPEALSSGQPTDQPHLMWDFGSKHTAIASEDKPSYSEGARFSSCEARRLWLKLIPGTGEGQLIWK